MFSINSLRASAERSIENERQTSMSARWYYRSARFRNSLLAFAALAVCGVILGQADDNIMKVQKRLKAQGFYFGNPNGLLDLETRDALTRYQMGHGLSVNGKLDAPTAKKLKASVAQAPTPQPQPTSRVLTGSWRRLPGGELEFVRQEPAATPSPSVINRLPAPPSEAPPATAPVAEDRHPPPSAPIPSSDSQPAPDSASNPLPAESVRDFVESFIQAGLALPLGAETKFFAERVNYLGTPGVLRRNVQRDLVRYDRKWPHRRFWIDGDIQIEQSAGSEIKVAFSLRYELQSGSRHASGKVQKSLTLLRAANDELQIIAVSESSMP